MPVFTSSIEVTADYPTIKPSLNLNFARARALDPRITFERASVGTYVDANGLIKTAGNNEPRFDHDPVTLDSLGLLIEESRTNFALYSDDFGNAAWVKQTGHGQSSNTTISPDGTENADTINRGASNQYIYQSLGVTGSHVISVWVKTPSGDGNKDFVMQHFNSTDNALGATTFTATEQWQRFYIVASPTVSGGWYPCIPVDIGQDFHVWGAQVEAGSFPTSYIPTSGSALARAGDDVKITGETFADWYNPSESTIFFESGVAPVNNSKYFTFHGTDGGGTELIESAAVSGPGANIFTYANSTTYANISVTDSGATTIKYAAGIKANDINLAVNGTLGTADTSSTQPDALDKLIIGNYSSGSFYLNNTIQKLTYYPKRLTNAQLQLLTS